MGLSDCCAQYFALVMLVIKLTFTRVVFFFFLIHSYYVRVLAWKICNGLSVSFLLWSYLLIQLKVVFNHGIIWLLWSKLFSCDVCLSNLHLWEWFFFSCSQLACKIPGMKNLLWIVSLFYLDHIYWLNSRLCSLINVFWPNKHEQFFCLSILIHVNLGRK